MDPEPNLKNPFNKWDKIEPYISYEENIGIKTFNVVSMIDDSESIIFTKVNFDSNYNFISGEIKALSFKNNEYLSLKETISNGVNLNDLNPDNLNPVEISILKTNRQNQTFEISIDGGMREIPYNKNLLDVIVLDNMLVTSKTDKINDYLMNYHTSKRLPINIFKEIEKQQTTFTVIKGSKQKIIKSA